MERIRANIKVADNGRAESHHQMSGALTLFLLLSHYLQQSLSKEAAYLQLVHPHSNIPASRKEERKKKIKGAHHRFLGRFHENAHIMFLLIVDAPKPEKHNIS